MRKPLTLQQALDRNQETSGYAYANARRTINGKTFMATRFADGRLVVIETLRSGQKIREKYPKLGWVPAEVL